MELKIIVNLTDVINVSQIYLIIIIIIIIDSIIQKKVGMYSEANIF